MADTSVGEFDETLAGGEVLCLLDGVVVVDFDRCADLGDDAGCLSRRNGGALEDGHGF